MATRSWSSDVPISMPTPTDHDQKVPMGGFCMTADGMAFDLSTNDLESLKVTLPAMGAGDG